jgi:hypothetical protein
LEFLIAAAGVYIPVVSHGGFSVEMMIDFDGGYSYPITGIIKELNKTTDMDRDLYRENDETS